MWAGGVRVGGRGGGGACVCVSVCARLSVGSRRDSIHLRCIVATVSQQTRSVVTKAELWPFRDTLIYLLIKIYDVIFHRCPPCLHFDTFVFSSEPHSPHPFFVLNWAPRGHEEEEIRREDLIHCEPDGRLVIKPKDLGSGDSSSAILSPLKLLFVDTVL